MATDCRGRSRKISDLGCNKAQTTSADETMSAYGLGLISTTDGSGNTSFCLPDGLGSTSQLTNSAGTVTDRYAYDAFGAMRSQSGATANVKKEH